MSYCFKYERSLFGYEEFEPIKRTHHPFIYAFDADTLVQTRSDLRTMRERERTHARQRRRETRGKADARGASFPGTAEQPLKRKQVISTALRRVNAELRRRRKLRATEATSAAAAKALAMARDARFRHHPKAEDFPNEGKLSLPSRRRSWQVHGAKIGSISQANKVSQGVRDTRR